MLHKYHPSYDKAPAWAKFAIEQFAKRGIDAEYRETPNSNWVWSPKGSIVLNKRTNTLSGVRPGGFPVHEGSEISFEAILGLIRSVLR